MRGQRWIELGVLFGASACTVGAPDEMQEFSSGQESAPSDTFDTGESTGESTAASATGTDSGDGDGDGDAGDGDGSGGDGDGGTGDGDGSTGDGDGSSGDGDGDGDGSSGDGDGDGTSGDGDGDGTSGDGDGDGYAHTILIDGVNDFALEETFTTSTPSHTAYVAWDATYVYLGMQGADVGGGNGQVFLLAYLGGTGTGTMAGELYGAQSPALGFDATHHVRWKADDTFSDAMTWDGAAWTSEVGFFTPGDVFRSGDFVELRIARANLGDPSLLDLHLGMLNEMPGGEWSWAAVPAGSYPDGLDPDYGLRFAFDLDGATVPNAHAPL